MPREIRQVRSWLLKYTQRFCGWTLTEGNRKVKIMRRGYKKKGNVNDCQSFS